MDPKMQAEIDAIMNTDMNKARQEAYWILSNAVWATGMNRNPGATISTITCVESQFVHLEYVGERDGREHYELVTSDGKDDRKLAAGTLAEIVMGSELDNLFILIALAARAKAQVEVYRQNLH